jgi:4-amino-4-deoxy-L-arabinose transferase-like glycosyltransferase
LFVVALFAPFVNKAFNIDDPLFLWVAKQLRHNPLDFYGFSVNWYETVMPMAVVTKNPPLLSYYLAGAGSLFGWSETSMHLVMLLPAIALVLGTFRLAGQLDADPLLAALIALCSPVFMVSGTTVMCDVPMVALWVWAVSFWIGGTEVPFRPWLLAAAGIMVAASGLTKDFGICLVPLLAAYSLARRIPVKHWLPYLLVPVVLFILYEWLTLRMYGVGLLTEAFTYSSVTRASNHLDPVAGIINGLCFTGGGVVAGLFFAPFLFRSRDLLICGAPGE